MRKLVIALLIGLIVIAGCNRSSDNKTEEDIDEEVDIEVVEEEPAEDEQEVEDTEGLALYILKIDEQAGVTVKNNDLYSSLQEMIDQDPTIGNESFR